MDSDLFGPQYLTSHLLVGRKGSGRQESETESIRHLNSPQPLAQAITSFWPDFRKPMVVSPLYRCWCLHTPLLRFRANTSITHFAHLHVSLGTGRPKLDPFVSGGHIPGAQRLHGLVAKSPSCVPQAGSREPVALQTGGPPDRNIRGAPRSSCSSDLRKKKAAAHKNHPLCSRADGVGGK